MLSQHFGWVGQEPGLGDWREPCFSFAPVSANKLIGVRHLSSSGRCIPVLLFRNEGGSVAGHCLLADKDTAIIDGPSPEAVLSLFERLIDDVLLARRFQQQLTDGSYGSR